MLKFVTVHCSCARPKLKGSNEAHRTSDAETFASVKHQPSPWLDLIYSPSLLLRLRYDEEKRRVSFLTSNFERQQRLSVRRMANEQQQAMIVGLIGCRRAPSKCLLACPRLNPGLTTHHSTINHRQKSRAAQGETIIDHAQLFSGNEDVNQPWFCFCSHKVATAGAGWLESSCSTPYSYIIEYGG